MSWPRRTLLALALGSGAVSPLAAQGSWVGHEPPCELATGHFLIGGAVLYLKQAVETRYPNERDGRLEEALRVLTRALDEAPESDQAAAWYYFGRYYVVTNDPAGADSAFRRVEALAPDCVEDMAPYRERMAALPLAEALRTWGTGALDSAKQFLALAGSLDPTDAEVPLQLSILYAGQGDLDSAHAYLVRGRELAQDDSTHARRVKAAMLGLARGYETRAYDEPAIQRAPQVRQARDSIIESMARDSSRLATMVGRVREIQDAGRRLDPESRRAFERESTTVAAELAGARAARDSLAELARADSAAVIAAMGPAIAQYQEYLAAYPDDISAAVSLVRIYSSAGRRDELNALVDQIVAAEDVARPTLIQAGQTLYGQGQHAAATRLMEKALAQNPYDRNALRILGNSYYVLKDGEHLRATAERLNAIDPLNQSSVRMLALVWALEGNRDSVDYYVAQADSGIGWAVNVNQFLVRDEVTSLSGDIRNIARRPLPETQVVVEFLDPSGAIVFADTVAVPALEPRGRAPLTVRRQEGGAIAWRYRRRD